MVKFTEDHLEKAIVELIAEQGYEHVLGENLERDKSAVLLKEDLRDYLANRYRANNITDGEIDAIVKRLESFPSNDLYDSNKAIMQMVADGLYCRREDTNQPDLYIELIDYSDLTQQKIPSADAVETVIAEQSRPYPIHNIYKVVNQLEVVGYEKRIPDCVIYINGLPLVVLEFKSAIREETTIHDAYVQLTTRYCRDIPELLKYNAICVISDGVNNRMGSLFSSYDYFYTWGKIDGNERQEKEGIDSLKTLVSGMLNPQRLRDVIRNFVYFPDTPKQNDKVICHYPQYYAATKLYQNIKQHQRPNGDGKGGTYYGATGSGKSFTMLFLTRLLMKSKELFNPTIVLITDRTDLDDQLANKFTNAKKFIGDETVISVTSREDLRIQLKGHKSGGVYLTTIHKFTEDTELLTERNNVICISDEAHRSQVNLSQKVKVSKDGVKKVYGFAKYLHDSLPNATYVGFTGTPIDATLQVFGDVVDSYTMTQSVNDGITVGIVYEGRAAKVLLDNGKLQEIEDFYQECEEQGASEYQIEESKRANIKMNAILGDPDRIQAVAEDFVQHYETRITENSTIKGKTMFVCSNRRIAYDFYQAVIALRPEWNEKSVGSEDNSGIPIEKIKLVMTRHQDDEKALYDLLGDKNYRQDLDKYFKNEDSNFKIAIVVDMWLTGFDVPSLDLMYIDKPVQRHNLIQAISRVNRKFSNKQQGLVVDYIGIKRQLNLAMALYAQTGDKGDNVVDIEKTIVSLRDNLSLVDNIFHKFNKTPYFNGTSLEQLNCLKKAAEFVQLTQDIERRFMGLVKKIKLAYDICSSSNELTQMECDSVNFYIAVRSIVFKLTKTNAPDITQMNAKVREMIREALRSDGVEEIFRMGEQQDSTTDIFSEEYLAKIEKIKLPNTKIKLLQQLLSQMISEYKKVNKVKGLDFSKQFKHLVDKYNLRKEDDVLVGSVLEDFTDEIIELYRRLKEEKESFNDMGIDLEEKAFYDILLMLMVKYDFTYPEDRLLELAKEVKNIVDDKTKYTDWNKREDIKADLKVALILLLAKFKYPPVDRDEVYQEIFEQAENFVKYKTKSSGQAD